MAEMECAWMNLAQVSTFAKKELKYCIAQTAQRCREEFILLEQDPEALLAMCAKEWPSIKYREALRLIKEKDGIEVPFGKDLRTEEERAIMQHYDTPLCVTHYPVEAMGFYKPRDPEFPDEALCLDILAPGTGVEIVGGSERSLDIEDMSERLKADGEDPADYQFYFDTRSYGSVPHAGYGVGIERVIAWICGLDNIKDAIPFPRTMLRWKP
jgi:asparaginyl-tRNA synthetase